MHALVSTINHILLVDLATAKVSVVETHRRDYYGISWWENSEVPTFTHSVLRGENLVTLEDYAHSEVGYLSFGEKTTSGFLSNPHQILCADNGWVVIANSGRNRITLFDPANGFSKDLRINNIAWDRLSKENLCGEHFNSVFIKNNRLYVLAHGFHKSAYVLEYSYPECELIATHPIKQRCGLHNIWLDNDNNMITCHSASGELIEIKTNEVLWKGAASYSRGFSVTNDLLIIGDSQIAMRQDREISQCGLWIVDRKTYKTIDYLPLGGFGSCHDVRLLDAPDEAHHGKIFKNKEWIEEIKNKKEKDSLDVKSDSFLQKHRETKIQFHQSLLQNSFVQNVTFIIGCVDVNKEKWMMPRDEYIHQSSVIAIYKKRPQNNYKVSLEYAFFDSDIFPEQNLSLIVGYRGSHDKNMIAIFLHYTKEKATHLYLMRNENGVWKEPDVIIPQVKRQGTLGVKRTGNILRISCNNFKTVKREIDLEFLEGDVGIRCQGSHFKNFEVAEV